MELLEELTDALEKARAEALELSKPIPELKKKLEQAQSRHGKRSEGLSAAQTRAEEAAATYRIECRKLASGDPNEALRYKSALDESEANLEGIKQLLADDEAALAAAKAELLEAEDSLASAQRREKEALAQLRLEQAVDRVEESFRSLISDIGIAIAEARDLSLDLESYSGLDRHERRLIGLSERLSLAKRLFF